MTLSHLATRRVDATLLQQCAASGQMDSRQIAAHIKASELDGIGCECALPPVVNDIKPVRPALLLWRSAKWPLIVFLVIVWMAVIWG